MNKLNVGESFQQRHEKASKKALGILNKLLHETQWFECPVCLELLQDVHVIPECMHRFCQSCITKSLDKCGRECPSCRCRIVGKRGLRKDVVMEGILQQIASAANVLDDACNMHEIIDIMDSESDDDSIIEIENLATRKRVQIEDNDENDTNVDKDIRSDSKPCRKRKLDNNSGSNDNYEYSSHNEEDGKPYANDLCSMKETEMSFDDDDDKKLWEGYKLYGKKWILISTKCFDSTRSENELKNRFHGRKFQSFVSENFAPGKGSKVNDVDEVKVDNDK